MGRQIGLIPIKGTFDDLNFYTTRRWGPLVRKKGGGFVSHKVKNGDNYVRTRENANEFKLANATTKQLLRHMHRIIALPRAIRVHTRLLSRFLKLKKMDPVSTRGQRTVMGALNTQAGRDFLCGFEFYEFAAIRAIVHQSIIVDTAAATITLMSFKPAITFKAPDSATHFVLSGACLYMDFENDKSELIIKEHRGSLGDATIDQLQFDLSSNQLSTMARFFVLRVSFTQEVNGVEAELNDMTFNAAAIVGIQMPPLP